jgi:hypothetical protein
LVGWLGRRFAEALLLLLLLGCVVVGRYANDFEHTRALLLLLLSWALKK